MRLDVFTLFPEWFDWFKKQRHVANAQAAGSELRLFNYRDSTPLGGGQVDDTPYGGGPGMVLRVDVVDAAFQSVYGDEPRGHTVLLDAGGRQLSEAVIEELLGRPKLTLLAGRYEGVDQRVRDHLCDQAISIGPYVLAGGELPAMVIADALLRRLPGALGAEESVVEESFSVALKGAPEYPHYTRPDTYRGWQVPEVLRSGDHEKIKTWRLNQTRTRSQ